MPTRKIASFGFRFVCRTAMAVASVIGLVAALRADPPVEQQREFFETRIRPVLVEHCYECHNSAKSAEGGLAVDHRAAFLKGGDSGAAIVPGQPDKSPLLAILRHEVDGLKMPKGQAKLSPRVIADFEKWIATGAFDPRDKPPSAAELAQATSWETVLKKRKQWWSFQPITNPPLPNVRDANWSPHAIDRFVLAKLEDAKLKPAEVAEAQTLVRRLFFVLIGLPPTPDEARLWTGKLEQPGGFEELVDHLLGSPHFGERWARHWMDWLRYAESHGSEGDPAIDNIWQYRDYLIRALNADVPFDQLVREHIAGDLLQPPRVNTTLGLNESAIGAAHWRMVFHGFAPTDALEEKVRFIDDQINVFSKAFLGLTISCARCHDHKFDAISQRDYYALFGILASCQPGRNAIDLPERLTDHRKELAALKPRIRSALAEHWLAAVPTLREHLLASDGPWTKADKPGSLLHLIFQLRQDLANNMSFAQSWRRQVQSWNVSQPRDSEQDADLARWWLARREDVAHWSRHGIGLTEAPSAAGDFAVAADGETVVTGIYPAGIYSHLLTAKSPARLSSPEVPLPGDYALWLRIIGDGGATARFVVHDYPRNGTVYPVKTLTKSWEWHHFDLTYWTGDPIRIELATGPDAPLLVNNQPRSWFGIREARIVRKGAAAPAADREFLQPIFEAAAAAPPNSMEELADRFVAATTAAIKSWQAGSLTDAQARLLDACATEGLLPNRLQELSAARPLVEEYRRWENGIVVPTRVPGLQESVGRDWPLFVRGNHKTPGDVVPRRFLEAIDAKPYDTPNSGREQLARDLLRDDNPLTRRVIVNRLWHHLFGRGIVATPDNLGRLGAEPTHPELLDHLATRLKENAWSLKSMIREIVTSKTWRLSSQPSPQAEQLDPDNRLLSHAHVRRLEAEAIRDSLLAASGQLNRDLFGPPVDGNSTRRSVYVRVIRNSLDPFLRAFDFPEPFSTVGQRDVTNVPAQALTLMNDERVASLASSWGTRVVGDARLPSEEQRIQQMFLTAFSRPAQPAELRQFASYLAETRHEHQRLTKRAAELRQQIEQRQRAIRDRIEPVHARLLQEVKTKSDAGKSNLPQPIARWEFANDLHDAIGETHVKLVGNARLEAGALVVGPRGYALSAPLKQTLKAKTLEAWVQLDTLNQRGGGVLTVQTPDGNVFDAMVFGEQSPREWLAGSNFFQRTQPFGGNQEADAATRAVHVAIAYHADGVIAAYRDGQPYGQPYKSNGPHEFRAGEAIVGFGIRHLPAGGNRMLSGRILRAQLYDRALSAEEIQSTAQAAPYFVPEAQVLAALSETDRQQVARDRAAIEKFEAELAALGPVPESLSEAVVWTDVARALFNFKEFVYVR